MIENEPIQYALKRNPNQFNSTCFEFLDPEHKPFNYSVYTTFTGWEDLSSIQTEEFFPGTESPLSSASISPVNFVEKALFNSEKVRVAVVTKISNLVNQMIHMLEMND